MKKLIVFLMFIRYTAFACAAGFAAWSQLVFGQVPKDAASDQSNPNFVFVMADDLGWGDVAYNGHPHIKTPHLDDMSRNGLRLDRFYAASPLCSPTRASCLTGRFPWRAGIFAASANALRNSEITIAEIAKKRGYVTGIYGKWHLGWVKPEDGSDHSYYSPPWHHHFDDCFVTKVSVPTWNPTITPEGFATSNQKVGDPWRGGKLYVHNGVEVTDNMEGDDSRVVMDRAIPFIRKAVESETPFLVCIWFHTPHEPVVAGPAYRALYKEFDDARQHHFGSITAMDEQIGRLRTELRKLKIEDNTVVFFCSDNGPADRVTKKGIASAGPYRGHKHTMYEGGLRVPSLIEWPGRVQAGSVSNTMTGTVDYFPTVAELLAITPKEIRDRVIDGVSLLPIIDGTITERNKPMFFGYRRLFQGIDGQAIMVDARHKLLRSADAKAQYELYDIVSDPEETNDLANELPELFGRLKNEMQQYVESCIQSYLGSDYPL
jgi:arylsulfatase A-like enzyme